MNGYYTKEEKYMQTAKTRATSVSRGADRVADVLFAMIAALVGLLRDSNVRRVVRYVIVAACFFCFVGLIGGIERGTISVGGGISLGLFLIFVEILCLK